MNPFLNLQSLLLGFVLSFQFLNMLSNWFRLSFMIKGKVHWSSNITLTYIGNLLFSHFCLCADVVQNIVNNLKSKSEMLTNSEAFGLKLRVLRFAQQRHSSQSIRHQGCSFVIRLVHVVSNDAFKNVVVTGYFVFRQSLNDFPCGKVVHCDRINFEEFWRLELVNLSTPAVKK